MRILFVSQTYLKRELGAAKVVIELAEEMTNLNWTCDLVSVPTLIPEGAASPSRSDLMTALRSYLREHAGKYDVVDYDHLYLPFPRSDFAQRPLFVARSVLLHRAVNPIPSGRTLRARVRSMVLGRQQRERYRDVVQNARLTMDEADLINVANHDDQSELVGWGFAPERIVVLPYGLSRTRQVLFHSIPEQPPQSSVVAFVGTFDLRKGAEDFPALVREVTARVPEASFLLLGTGIAEAEVLARFPRSLQGRVRVIAQYDPNALPELLAGCAVGVFPSYLESFGFGVLEMLAAAVPVIAYDAPGPPMMLPPAYLVPRGDVRAMSSKVISLLGDREALTAARTWAKQRAAAFSWKDIAAATSEAYLKHLHKRAESVVGG